MRTDYSIPCVYQHNNILESPNNLKLCSICLENINEDDAIKVYVCNHLYHRQCITNWNGNCPDCRSARLPFPRWRNDVTITNELPSISEESIEGFKRCNQRVPTNFHNIYHQTWKKNDCVTNNHNLIFLKPYGVVGICEDCKIIQCFNLIHPV